VGSTIQPPVGAPYPDQTSILLAEYEFARENRNQANTAAWEMTAIMWGGQTLLLGFALEAVEYRSAQPLIVVLSLLGIVLSCFNYVVMQTRILVCHQMVDVCYEIEDLLPMVVKPQHRLNPLYPKKKQTRWFYAVNFIFAAAWILVGLRAGVFYCHSWGR